MRRSPRSTAAVADEIQVRRARTDDVPAIAPLLHMPAVGLDRMAGSRETALRIIAADLERGGRDVTWVAELDGAPVGVLVAYPCREQPARARRFLAALLRHAPPWRWAAIALLQWRGDRRAPQHPGNHLFIDALATEGGYRRRGVATALLERADRIAARGGFPAIALNARRDNDAALALYRRAGFRKANVLTATPPDPEGVVLVKELA